MEISNPVPVLSQEMEKKWRPYPKQAAFISIPDTVFEAMFGGSKGPGKTDTLIMLPCIRQFTEHPKFKCLHLRRRFTDLEQEIIIRQKEWYTPAGAVYNETKRRWQWPSGAIIQNGHAEHEDDVRRYDTSEYNEINWDEGTHFTPFQYEYLSFTRCRSSSPELPAIVRVGTNPGNVGHTYFRKRFVDPYRAGGRILVDKLTKLKRMFIPAFSTDNPKLLENDPTYLQKLNMLPEAERRAAFGDWYTFSGQVFEEFRLEPLSGEPENARHVISPFNIPSWWPRILAVDWGFSALTVAGWGAIAPNGRLYVYRIYAIRGKQIRDWSVDIANLSRDEGISDAVVCHSAAEQRGEPHTIQQQIQSALNECGLDVQLRLGERDRIGGKMLLHEYLRWKPKPIVKAKEGYSHELAMNLFKFHGEKKYKDYINFFKEEPPEINLPKIQIFYESKEGLSAKDLIECIPNCIYEEKNLDGKSAEDVKEFDGDDYYDMLRMLIRRADEYVSSVVYEFEERKRVDEICSEYSQTGDTTRFYRKMEHLESEGPISGLHSVRQHSRRGRR